METSPTGIRVVSRPCLGVRASLFTLFYYCGIYAFPISFVLIFFFNGTFNNKLISKPFPSQCLHRLHPLMVTFPTGIRVALVAVAVALGLAAKECQKVRTISVIFLQLCSLLFLKF